MHGTYVRLVPIPTRVARAYCPTKRVTFGLLPTFFASRFPGTLDDLEQVVAAAETAASREAAVELVRPSDADGAVELPGAIRWLRRRVRLVQRILIAVMGLFPDRFAGGQPTIAFVREVLGTVHALVELRAMAAVHLYTLPRPLGLGPPPRGMSPSKSVFQQSLGPDPRIRSP